MDIPIDLYSLAKKCSPSVAPSTMVALIKTESRGNRLALGLNGARLRFQPKSESQAIAWVRYLDKHGYNYDVGLAQINIKNIRKFNLKPEQLLEPCTNISIAGKILTVNYLTALNTTNNAQEALRKALSKYNTGNNYSGYQNGYIYRVLQNLD